MKVAYLGPKGTFTEEVAKELFGAQDIEPLQPIRAVVLAVENERAEFGVVPLENFYNGEVRQTLDALTKCEKTRIIQEHSAKIEHCLGGLHSTKTLNMILSKDQALEQCSEYIFQNYPNATEMATPSTAEAAQRVARENLVQAAAIASRRALVAAGLEVFAEDIVPNNKTRFAVLSRSQSSSTGDDKTLIAIHPPIKDKPGVLYGTLGFFSSFGINLEDIKSRPDGHEGYYFYVELDGHEKDEAVARALSSIRFSLDPRNKYRDTVRVLGSYANSHWKDMGKK